MVESVTDGRLMQMRSSLSETAIKRRPTAALQSNTGNLQNSDGISVTTALRWLFFNSNASTFEDHLGMGRNPAKIREGECDRCAEHFHGFMEVFELKLGKGEFICERNQLGRWMSFLGSFEDGSTVGCLFSELKSLWTDSKGGIQSVGSAAILVPG